MSITVKFVGALRYAFALDELTLGLSSCKSIRELLDDLAKEIPNFQSSLIGNRFKDPRPNALVLVNGREVGVLEGLDTALVDGDEIVFVPIVHGG